MREMSTDKDEERREKRIALLKKYDFNDFMTLAEAIKKRKKEKNQKPY